MAMKQVEIKMFLHRKPDGTDSLHPWDRTIDHNGQADDWGINQHGACMGRVVVVGEYEDIEGDPREKLIEGLEKAVEKERVASQVRVNLLLERISQLKCLAHEPAKS